MSGLGADLTAARSFVDGLAGIAGWVGDQAGRTGTQIISGIRDAITEGVGSLMSALGSAVRSAINSINLDFGWIRISGLSGVTFNIPTPSIPGFAHGGIVPGPIGRLMLAVVHGGEEVVPYHRREAPWERGGNGQIVWSTPTSPWTTSTRTLIPA